MNEAAAGTIESWRLGFVGAGKVRELAVGKGARGRNRRNGRIGDTREDRVRGPPCHRHGVRAVGPAHDSAVREGEEESRSVRRGRREVVHEGLHRLPVGQAHALELARHRCLCFAAIGMELTHLIPLLQVRRIRGAVETLHVAEEVKRQMEDRLAVFVHIVGGQGMPGDEDALTGTGQIAGARVDVGRDQKGVLGDVRVQRRCGQRVADAERSWLRNCV